MAESPRLGVLLDPHVFISYARADLSYVSALAARLSQAHVIWWDADLIGGEPFEQRILEIIPASRAVVCVVSRTSSSSEWVKKEVDAAIASGIPVIPVAIDDHALPAHFADKNVIFLNRDSLDAEGEGLARLLRDLAIYDATAVPSKRSDIHPTKIRSRYGPSKFLALLAALGAIAGVGLVIGTPFLLEIQEEQRQAEAEVVQLQIMSRRGLALTQEQADWMNSALAECDVTKVTTPAFGERTGDAKRVYELRVGATPATVTSVSGLEEYCRSEFGLADTEVDVCVRSIMYIRNHAETRFSAEESLIQIEVGGVETTPGSGVALSASFDVCAAARKAEYYLNRTPLRTLETPTIPAVQVIAACLRNTPYSKAGLQAEAQGRFRSIEHRLLDAGCIDTGLPKDAVGIAAAIPLMADPVMLEREERDAIAHPLVRERDLDRAIEKMKAYDAERKNAAGVMRVFSDDSTLKRIGFRLLSEAAASGHLQARANLGLCQLLGIGTAIDAAGGSANIRAAVQAGLALDQASWAWRESLSGFKVGNVPLLIKTLELKARSGDPAFKAYLAVLNSRGVGACQPRCLDSALRLAGELRAAGHAQWASIVTAATDAGERKLANSLTAPSAHLPSASRSAKWTPQQTRRAPKPPLLERVLVRVARLLNLVR